MNTLVRNPTTRNFSRRINGYEPLDRYKMKHTSKNDDEPHSLVPSFSYRRERARQRQIYLKSYKLSSLSRNHNNLRRSRSWKLKKVVVKVRTAVVSLVSFLRAGACNSRDAICASNPMRCC